MEFSVGDRAPDIVGATAGGRFYSLDAQAGRPALLVAPGGDGTAALARAMAQVRRIAPDLRAAGVDLVPIAPAEMGPADVAADLAAEVVYVMDDAAAYRGAFDTPVAILIDRGARIVDVVALDGDADLAGWFAGAAPRIVSPQPRRRMACAPVLVIPNVASPAFCRALIDHFEASAHQAGAVAAFAGGVAYAKLDEDKKKRRDVELTPESPLYDLAVALLAARCAPEIKRAFQTEMATADRLLIARYDDTGGYFKRHRDNTAPHTAFREFAISLNLNTEEYEGGELLFPEYDDDRYSPPAGAALIFSAGLLHEAAPVTRGRRYVLLSFLGSAAAQRRLDAWQERQR